MDDTIAIAAGSVAGRAHRKLSRPNQDAVAWQRVAGRGAVLVVCDGCGGAARSEVGAALGARLWTRALAERLERGEAADPALFEAAAADVLGHLGTLAAAMAAEPTAVVVEHFMFTTVAAAITADALVVHAIGDGVVALGGELHVLGPFPDNQPPYLAQALLGGTPGGSTWVADPREHDRVIIASDGAGALVGAGGLDELVTDVVFRNPAALTRRLALLAEDTTEIDWEARRIDRRAALLDDDTTIAIARWRTGGAS
jgi:hypothetical protein